MRELHNRLDATMTDTIQHTYLREYSEENTLDMVFRQPTGNAGLVRHSCKVRNKTNKGQVIILIYHQLPYIGLHIGNESTSSNLDKVEEG